jgi:dipeptidyl aminopeptidase/acylaminoacyl peptidase
VSRLRLSLAVVLALFTGAFACVPSADAIPPGPRLVFLEGEYVVKVKEGEPSAVGAVGRLVNTDPSGNDPRILPTPSSLSVSALRFSWAADGSKYAFFGKPVKLAKKERAGKGEEAATNRVYVINADGTGLHRIDGTEGTNSAVISPDGSMVAFTRTHAHHPPIKWKNPKSILESFKRSYLSRTTWIVPTAGGKPRRLTSWSNHLLTEPTSFSPDGATLLVSITKAGSETEVDAIDLATGKRRTIEADASEASYSADGSKIAFISNRDHESMQGFADREAISEVYVAAADGSGATRVTHTPKTNEIDPNFDPSGARLAYLAAPGGLFGSLEGRATEINVDGTCTATLSPAEPRRKKGVMLIGIPSWLPGPERGAGPLSC